MTATSRRTVLGAVPLAATAVLATGAAASANAEAPAGRIPDELCPGGELDRFVADLAARDKFSGTLLLTRRGRTVLARAHGMADKSRSVPNRLDTVFGLASVTKWFTAVAIAHLARARKVNYEAPLGTYLDGFPAAVADHATIHHLLTHTSGLGDFHNLPGYEAAAATWTSAAEVMAGTTELIRGMTPAFPPGAGSLYSNAGYHLLGEIVAATGGMSYYDYVREHVFRAAGMTGASYPTKPEWRASRRIAHPYYRDPDTGAWVDSLEEHPFIGEPAGGAFATCADLDRFTRVLHEGQLLGPGATQLVLSGKLPMPAREPGPQSVFVCYGAIGTLADDRWSFEANGGGSQGASTTVQTYPASGWVAVVLSNYPAGTTAPIAGLARRLITTKGQK